MNSSVAIRRAVAADLERAAELAGALVRMHHGADSGRFFLPERVEQGYAWWFRRELERKEAVILVATRGELVVGYAYGTIEERNWNALLDEHGAIHDIFVDETARRSGLGQKLVRALIAELEGLGAQRIVLSTMVDNQAAQRVFLACGFRPTMIEMTRNGG